VGELGGGGTSKKERKRPINLTVSVARGKGGGKTRLKKGTGGIGAVTKVTSP